jgi:nucleoside-diphosphate-sugar epimerase
VKVLFIGGTGVISSACSDLLIERGAELTLLARGLSRRRPPEGAELIRADIRDEARVGSLLARRTFDAVVDWIAYTEADIARDHGLFGTRTSQYVFISSASVYRRPPGRLPVTEEEPLVNPYWAYSQAKIRAEDALRLLGTREGFPYTIVRPSHTYDRTKVPLHGGATALARLRTGKPVIIHGDGSTLWTLTHHTDFAAGFVGLLGNDRARGEAYHITSDEALSWNEICSLLGEAAGITPRILHVSPEVIRRFDKEWGDGLLGDKAYSMVFDNAKIRTLVPDFRARVPFREGAREIVSWYAEDASRGPIDRAVDELMERIIAGHARRA